MKFSKQRNQIREKIIGRKDHPTAQMIYDEMKQNISNISLATVYRNLNQLVEQGELKKICFAGNTEHYDPDLSEHFHFICERCGKIFDLSIKTQFDKMDNMIENEVSGKILYHDLVVHGLCKNCK